MKKILIAPDSFKGSLSAAQAAEIIAEEAKRAFPDAEVLTLPVSDGGEGLVDAVLGLVGGKRHAVSVHDPLMRELTAVYGELPNGAAVIEMAAARPTTVGWGRPVL
jgi:glycerate kinase